MKIVFCLLVLSAIMLSSCSDSGADDEINHKVDALLSQMTLKEKIGQMNQLDGRRVNEALFEAVRKGDIGSILNIEEPELVNEVQKIAMEESRLGIPLLIARDVIHGYKTIFPIPLGQAASFNPSIVEGGARIAAVEASREGIC
ncbi:glycoside hydrolase family 3 N-terminal domain-containing protein [Marinilabilia salmonicolor]|uniref:glycoside hydrolase family 3 N-terminal domain-containing protein n=1 Tax=Marinilabilia salmonicolor TaxID=989 RepID=UPI00031D37CD|nr:glycoside hydrolase family 3 N-terminal domain-containing protein [Marinilabilia salmonicolor]